MATYKYCEKCNKKFEVEHRGQRYCSNECQKELPYYRRKIKCPECGKFFKPKMYQRKTCDVCRRNYYVTCSRFRILERDKFTCIYCGKSSFEDGAELHLDHIHPYSKGGKNTAKNLVTACKRCNIEKSNRLLKNPELIIKEIKKRNAENNMDDNLRINLERGSNRKPGR